MSYPYPRHRRPTILDRLAVAGSVAIIAILGTVIISAWWLS